MIFQCLNDYLCEMQQWTETRPVAGQPLAVGDTSKNTFKESPEFEAALALRMPLVEASMNLELTRTQRDALLAQHAVFVRQQLREEQASAELLVSKQMAASTTVRSPY